MGELGRGHGLRRLVAVTGAAALLLTMAAAPMTAQEATKHVSIIDQDLTDAQIAEAIKAEGSLIVGNWTYTANDELISQFKQYVKDTYGADINFTYEGSQSPSTYLTGIYAAQAAGNATPYDVLAVEENYWAEAMAKGAVADVLPSDLIPNQALVLDSLQHAPTAIAFQAASFPGVVYSASRAPYLTKLMDLADPRLKGKVTLPLPGDITAGGFFLGLAAELGKDYTDAAQMKEVVDWAIANIGPNVIKYTSDSAEMQQLLQSGAADAVTFWNSLARLEYFGGNTDAALLVPENVFPVNGYLWVAKGAQHPVLAQVFINWRISPEVQFPNSWPIEHGPWAELQEGFLGETYQSHIPDWFQADYAKYYPTLDQIQNNFKQVDWNGYNAAAQEWQDYYAQQIGM